MSISSRVRLWVVVSLLLSLASGPVLCDNSKFFQAASDSITPFLALGQLSLMGNDEGAQQAAKALAATSLATQFLKSAVGEKRPNTNSMTSFPSGHTSSAFAMATVVACYRPKLTVPVYAAATLIGVSRVETGAHHWWDVIGGAALGYCTAKHFCVKDRPVNDNVIAFTWKL